MGFSLRKPQKARKEAKAAREAQLTDHQKSYRDREKREEKRFQMAVDSGFWICFCFHDAEERGRFADLVKADAEGWTFGDVIRPVFEERIGLQNKRQFKPKEQKGTPMPNPLDSVETTDSLEGDSFAEADARSRRSSRLRLSPTTTTFGAAPTTSCACSATSTTSKASSGSMPWRSTATCTWTGRRSLRPLRPKANLTRIGKSRRPSGRLFCSRKREEAGMFGSYSPRSGKHRQPSALRVQSRSRQLFRPLLLLRGVPGPARS